MSETVYKIILADDHEIVRDGISAIITGEKNLNIVGLASNGNELLILAKKLLPDLCIVDLDMPVLNGLQASEILVKELPEIKILILTMHNESSLLKKMQTIGIKGFLPKTCDRDELVFAINRILKGKTQFANIETKKFGSEMENSDLSKVSLLTPREKEIASLLCLGNTNKQISEKLFLSPKTVDNHRSSIMKKIDAHNVVELIRFFMRNNIQ